MIVSMVLIGVFAAFVYALLIYNRLVQYRVGIVNAWSQIDVQLKRRYDLIPNLVNTVRGMMEFETGTLTKVMQARSQALSAPTLEQRMKSETEISGLLGRIMAVWENYPQLKSNANAVMLQEELAATENRLADARGHYNDLVANFNTLLEQFPSSIVASLGRFVPRDFFLAPENERQVSQVKF